jgi:Superinfection immunity protein
VPSRTEERVMNKVRAAYQRKADQYLDGRQGVEPMPADLRVAKGAASTIVVVLLVVFHVVTLGYFVPIWVASHRRVPNTGSVAVIDIFLGWTIIGWAVALAMACRSVPGADHA